MGATWRIVHSVGRSDAPTDDPPSIPTPLFVLSSLGPCTRHNMCVCVRVCVRVRLTSAHRTRVMGARTPPIRDFSVVKARLISTHPIRDVRSRGSFVARARRASSRQNTTRHDDDVYRYEHPMRGQGARDTTDRVCSRTHASSPARSRRRTRAPIARMDWRRRGLGRGCVDAMGFASRARGGACGRDAIARCARRRWMCDIF